MCIRDRLRTVPIYRESHRRSGLAYAIWMSVRTAAPGLFVAIMLLLPFYDKAFTVDDTLFLREAQQALAQPLSPAAFEVVWDLDVPIRGSAGLLITGPVTAYLLIPAVL